MFTQNIDLIRPFAEGPETALEWALIEAHLLQKGYRLQDLDTLPDQVANRLMEEASKYASLRLSEIKSRNRFHEEIRSPGG